MTDIFKPRTDGPIDGAVASESRAPRAHGRIANRISVLARQDLQNSYLCNSLDEQLDVEVSLSSDLSLPSMRRDSSALMLIDVQHYDGNRIVELLDDYQRDALEGTDNLAALFNLAPQSDEYVCRHYVGWRCLRGLFRERSTIDHLVKGLKAMLDGEYWIPRRYLGSLISNGTRRPEASVEDPGLTQKERQILEILVLGKTNDEIASSLNISPHTVKTHVYNLYKKLGVNNRVEASNWAQNFLSNR